MSFPVNILFCALFFCLSFPAAAQGEIQKIPEKTRRGKHFVIHYADNISKETVLDILTASERYYTSIAQRIGYVRYHKFWAWDERVQIVIYSDKETYTRETGQPEWSLGSASTHHAQFNSRAIFSYKDSPNFVKGILPHEIGHLILNDFIGDATALPIWFNEGVAQLQESNKRREAAKIVQNLKNKQGLLSIQSLHHIDVRVLKKPVLVTIFYAQSVSIVDYMINAYGSSRFSRFCRQMKEGKPFEEALRFSYRTIFDSLEDLEKKWLSSIPSA